MEIIDAQLHEPGIDDFWSDHDPTIRRGVLDEALHTLLAAVGVSGAVLHPVEDVEWAHSVAAREPHRFAVVPMLARVDSPIRAWWDSRRWDSIDPTLPDLEERLERALERPGFAGLRVFATAEMNGPPAPASGYHVALAWCERRGVPIFVAGAGLATVIGTLVRTFPGLVLVLDQMGLHVGDPDVWSGVPSAARTGGLPDRPPQNDRPSRARERGLSSEDIGRRLRQIVETFGARDAACGPLTSAGSRGGSGCGNRFPHGDSADHTYAESLSFVRDAAWLDDEDTHLLLGGTTRRLLRWPTRPG